MAFLQVARNLLGNGLTILQRNPDCAAQLNPQAHDFGWLYVTTDNGDWVTHRKLEAWEIETAQDQAADMNVWHNVRAG